AIGDVDTVSRNEIAIGAPTAFVNGRYSAGAVYVYKWDTLTTGNTGANTTPERTVTGVPTDMGAFGASIVAVAAAGDTLAHAPDYVLMTRPGLRVNLGSGQPGWGPSFIDNVGAVDSYSTVHMKIGSPFVLTGSDPSENFGRSLVSLPDVDGDGLPDL